MQTEFASCFPLPPARVHEVCGSAAPSFAACSAASAQGSALWVRETWLTDALHPVGFASFLDPSLVLIAQTKGQTDSLAVAEEALKDGTMQLIIIETTRPLDLREGRRLQLAAEAGQTTGLCLIPEGMGSNAAETRWHCTPVFDADDLTLMRWEIIKNISGTFGAWHVRWNAEARRLDVVSPVGERPGSARTAG